MRLPAIVAHQKCDDARHDWTGRGSQETRDRVSDNVLLKPSKTPSVQKQHELGCKESRRVKIEIRASGLHNLARVSEQPSIRACVCTIPNGSPASLDIEARNRPRSVGLSRSRLAVIQVFEVSDDLRSCTDTYNILPRHSKYYDERVHLSLLVQRPIDTEPA